MRKEIGILLVLVVVIAGVAWWWTSQPVNPPITCPRQCTYGCIPQTSTCRAPTCPSSCKFGCIEGTTQCKSSNISVTPVSGKITACGMVNETSNVGSSLYSDGTCLTINNDDITLDCNDNVITGSGRPGSYGIYIRGRKNITLVNCVITNYSTAVMVDSSSGIYISGVDSKENSNAGIIVNFSRDVSLAYAHALQNQLGFWVIYSSNITFRNSPATSNSVGMRMESSQGIKLFDSGSCESSLVDTICDSTIISASSGNDCKTVEGCTGTVCSQCDTHTEQDGNDHQDGGGIE